MNGGSGGQLSGMGQIQGSSGISRDSSPTMAIHDDDFAKGLGVSGMVGSSSLRGGISTQAGAADTLNFSTGAGGGGLSSFNSSMNMISNFEAHRLSSGSH